MTQYLTSNIGNDTISAWVHVTNQLYHGFLGSISNHLTQENRGINITYLHWSMRLSLHRLLANDINCGEWNSSIIGT